MAYKTTTIQEIADQLKFNLANNLGTAILTGAGVSVSAKIPTSNGIIEKIEETFPALSNKCIKKTYCEYMKLLTPMVRRRVINDLIENAELNPAHLYLSSLVKNGYIDRILTVNFDPLAQKALALENIFPGIYDFAASQNFVPGEAADISIFHLHGQKDGFVLLNTEPELDDHFKKLKPVFNDSLIKRTLIVIGYSGVSDPVFRHLKEIKSFEGRLYWIGFEDHEPSEEIVKDILEGDKYSFFLKGYNADTFFIELSKELGIEGPRIVSRPFEYLSEVLENFSLLEMKDKPPTDIVKETKKWVKTAKAIFQDHDKEAAKDIFENLANEELIKLARETWLNDSEENYEELLQSINDSSPVEAKLYFSFFLNNYGLKFVKSAKLKTGTEVVEGLYRKSIAMFEKALEFNPDLPEAYYNWGASLSAIAKLKTGSEAEALYREAIAKYEKGIALKPDDMAYLIWGAALADIAKLKSGSEVEALYRDAINKYKQAIDIKPDMFEAFSNWGAVLADIAKLKSGSEVEELYRDAIAKYEKALEFNPDLPEAYFNWGVSLSNIAELNTGTEAEELYRDAIVKLEKSIALKPDDMAYLIWGMLLASIAKLKSGEEAIKLYREAIAKFEKALKLNPDMPKAYSNWGAALADIAKLKSGSEKEKLLQEAIELLEKQEEKNPGYYLYNLACLYSLLNDKSKAVQYLHKCKKAGHLPKKDIILNDEDFNNISIEPEFIEFLSELEDKESED